MRVFIALELDDGIKMKLGALQRQLRSQHHLNDPSIKWVHPDNIHLTLKFLGEVEDRLINDVCLAVTQTASQFEPFDFHIAGVGSFPPGGSARVLWTGVTEGGEDLQALAEAIDHACHKLGFPLEARKFSSHITLARVKNLVVGHKAREAVETTGPLDIGAQGVSNITVFQSVLERGGPAYTAMHHARLR
ncbi:MAG: RNA 2',3'-cyclic phosphodiesterase [Sedimentisphaerales bacterium]|nr:RNA 2',3'-cyclic phosphodiesterase [Sedimentisphaerales bacterium]